MKTFSYRGFARDGSRARGMIEALDPKDAREKLAARGIFSESVQPVSGAEDVRRDPLRFGVDRRAAFYREFAALARAGVPAVGALELLMSAQPDARHAPVLAGIRDRVREGASLADALLQTIPDVTDFEIALVQTGQRTGRLGDVLDQMAGYLEDEHHLLENLRSALIYPALVVALALIIGFVMIVVVLPRLGSLFGDADLKMPVLTRALIWLGQEGRPLAIFAILFPIVLSVWSRALWMRPDARFRMQRVLSRMPLIGVGIRLAASLRFVRTLAVLISGGVPIVEALPLAGRASGYRALEEAVRNGTEGVRQGRPVADMLAGCPLIGSYLPPWYRAGEAAGDLPGMLEQAARRLQHRWEKVLQRAIRLIEPLLIIMVGGFVLLIALAILMPLLSLNQATF